MPGAPLGNVVPTYQDVQGAGVPAAAAGGGVGVTSFLVWLVIIGVVIPVLILGGLRAGGFQFVYKRRS